MTSRDAKSVDYLSYVDLAIGHIAARPEPSDRQAMEVSVSIQRLAHALERAIEQRAHRPAGWSMAGFRVMFLLWVLGPSRPAAMAATLDTTRPAVSNVITTLERAGLVERSADATDGRSVIVSLTAQGRDGVSEVWARQNEVESAWLGVLTPDEQRTLTDLLARVIAAHAGETANGSVD